MQNITLEKQMPISKVAGEAENVITGDKDLLDLKRYKKIKIVMAQRFLIEAVK